MKMPKVKTSLMIAFTIVGASQVAAKVKTISPTPVMCAGALFDGKAKYNEEISGVKCFAQGKGQSSCFIVADEKKGLQQISITQTAGGKLSCTPGPVLAKKRGLWCLPGKKPERDFESIASDGRSLFIAGSWGNRRKKSVMPSPERWALIAQPLDGAANIQGECRRVQRKNIMSLLKNAKGGFEYFADTPLQCGGLNVEGMAYQNGKLFFGLRSPSVYDNAGAWVITAKANELFAGNLPATNAKREYLTFRVNKKPIKGIGIRALEPLGRHRMLVVTGPAGVSSEKINDEGRYLIETKCRVKPFYQNAKIDMPFALWIWTPKTGRLEHLGNVAGPYAGQKFEGLSVLSFHDDMLSLLLTFDGINNDEGSPIAHVKLRLQ